MITKNALQNIENLISLLINNDDKETLLRELVSFLAFLYPNCDISILSSTNSHTIIFSSTATNVDIRENIEKNVQSLNLNDMFYQDYLYTNNRGIWYKTIPLSINEKLIGFLVVSSDKEIPTISGEKQIVSLSTIALNSAILYQESMEQTKKDRLTGLYTRDGFMDDIRELSKKEHLDNGMFSVCLCVMGVSNMPLLNQKNGLSLMDKELSKIGNYLRNLDFAAYRIGGVKFALILPYDVVAAGDVCEYLLDDLIQLNENIKWSMVISPLCEDIYKTVYWCDSRIKSFDGDAITIIHPNEIAQAWDEPVYSKDLIIPCAEEYAAIETNAVVIEETENKPRKKGKRKDKAESPKLPKRVAFVDVFADEKI